MEGKIATMVLLFHKQAFLNRPLDEHGHFWFHRAFEGDHRDRLFEKIKHAHGLWQIHEVFLLVVCTLHNHSYH